MDFFMEQLPAQPMLFMRRTGAYGIENNKLMETLKEWAKRKGLFKDSIIYGIAHDNPAYTPQEQCRYDVCLVAETEFGAEDEAVQKGEILGGKYAVFTVPHTEEAVREFWTSVFQNLQGQELQIDIEKPILERYRYQLVEDGKCEFCVPIV